VSVNSVQFYIKGLLEQLIIPGPVGTLEVFITPPDPKEDADRPTAYVWPADGSEKRRSLPRNNGPATVPSGSGWKDQVHRVQIYLIWFAGDDEADVDSAFPSVVDAVLFTLRTSSPNPAYATDPVTGVITQLVNIGEEQSYEIVPVHALADQRWNRYDARITVSVLEEFQS
jgi:hypothetical protein